MARAGPVRYKRETMALAEKSRSAAMAAPRSAAKDRLARLFQFLRAFNDQHHPAPRQVSQQPWCLDLAGLPRGEGDVILTVSRPELTEAPAPPPDILPWIGPGWDDPFVAVEILAPGTVRRRRARGASAAASASGSGAEAGREPTRGKAAAPAERLEEDPGRARELKTWCKAREAWAEREQPARRALRLFEALYALHALMEREGERHELILGDGILFWRRKDGDVQHPILLQRLQLEFDPDVPEFRLRESAQPPEVYTSMFSSLAGIDGHALARIRDRFNAAPCHPLGGAETAEFLSFCAVQLSPRGRLVTARPSETPEDPLILRAPMIFQRTRTLGFGTAIEAILEDIEAAEDRELCPALARIVGVDPPLPAIDADLDGEPRAGELLLSKPANVEQIRIAERLEKYGSVLVQGPPGTGKTHTIANLIGHLLAQGKTVLVTADTTKALRVVRHQVEEKLRPLCVSVLDNDLEGRKQLEEAVAVIADEISHADVDDLARAAREKARIRAERALVLERAEAELQDALLDEYRPITDRAGDRPVDGDAAVPAGEAPALSPAEAARWLAREGVLHGWIPLPVERGALPLGSAELAELYRTNGTTTAGDEFEIEAGALPVPAGAGALPGAPAGSPPELAPGPSGRTRDAVSALPDPEAFEALVQRIRDGQRAATDEGLWRADREQRGDLAAALEVLEALDVQVQRAERAAALEAPWQLAALHAGCKGGPVREPWDRLLELIADAEAVAAAAQEHLVRHAPYLEVLGEEDDLLEINAELEKHVAKGGGLGAVDLIFRPRWREYLNQATVSGRRPETEAHFAALGHLLRLREARRALALRWDRLVRAAAGPAATDLGPDIEVSARQLASRLESLLGWQARHGRELDLALERAGFDWQALLEQVPPGAGPFGEVQRTQDAIRGPLRRAIRARLEQLRAADATQRLQAVSAALGAEGGPAVTGALARAIEGRDPAAYRAAHARLLELHQRRADVTTRARLLAALEPVAPGWAAAIRRREGAHGGAELPGDPAAAWTFAQATLALEGRAARELGALMEGRRRASAELDAATADLIEARAWLAQRQRMTLTQQQALTGWLDTQRAMGKGTGKKVPELKAEARRLMSGCQTAVPVWIMPVSRVVESFDAREVRFDVVIIDEASQCDLFALAALYLGRQVVVVGDHEQVSPSAVGESVESSAQLIAQHLGDIPNAHLYDGRLSVYDLARQSFGGLLALREHFRSVPHIIEFSNQLSYLGRIQPLRSAGMVEILPTTIALRASGSRVSGKVNRAEAETVAALVIAATEQPEYGGATFGAISLVGEEQAFEIEALLRRHLAPTEFDRRRIVCGNAAHFQGDERDVMLLSLVDVASTGPLPLRDQQSFKQRFNVAASRARSQMWVVHSLDPEADLKPDDLRRRLILHAELGDGAGAGGTAGAAGTWPADPHGRTVSELERALVERLRQAGYDVRVGWPVGDGPLDIVVQGDGETGVALRADGDRTVDAAWLRADLARQAVLERLGWRFLRIRGSEFLRGPHQAMRAIAEALAAEGVGPRGARGREASSADGAAARAPDLAAAGGAQPGPEAGLPGHLTRTRVPDLAARVIARATEIRASGFAGLRPPPRAQAALAEERRARTARARKASRR